MTVPLLFGIVCAVTVRTVSTCPGALLLAWSLVAYWAIANLLWQFNALWGLPILDLVLGVEARIFASMGRNGWLIVFLDIIAIRLVLHMLDAFTGSVWLVPYLYTLNFTFAMLLGTLIFWAGGMNGGVRLSNLFRGLRRLLPFGQAA